MRTQVGIIGAGPAGLVLALLLAQKGVESVVVEKQSRAYVEARLRAGLLEHNTIELLCDIGVGERMMRKGLEHHGIELRIEGHSNRIDIHGMTNGRRVMIYGQHEIVKDLIAACLSRGIQIIFEAKDVAIDDLTAARPIIRFNSNGDSKEISVDLVAGCDGFHGISRASFPDGALKVFERDYPFAWLGILAEAPPVSPELIYAKHRNGFALYTMRSNELSRLYLQCAPDDDLEQWSEARIWEELDQRIEGGDGKLPPKGRMIEKSITGMRSFVVEPMQFGNLFLAGDAAHIVPPTGAKGMNLAIADVAVLAAAMEGYFHTNDRALLDAYSEACLTRVWRAEQFSWWMTAMLHKFPHPDPFEQRLRDAELHYALSTETGRRVLAENYAGLAWDLGGSQ